MKNWISFCLGFGVLVFIISLIDVEIQGANNYSEMSWVGKLFFWFFMIDLVILILSVTTNLPKKIKKWFTKK